MSGRSLSPRLLVFSTAVFLGALALAFTDTWPWPRLEEAPPIVITRAWHESSDTLRAGETVGELFGRQGLRTLPLTRLAADFGLDPRRLRAGLVFSFRRLSGEAEPSEILVRIGAEERMRLSREGDEWTGERLPIAWRTETYRVHGDIASSLYLALDGGVPETVLDGGERVRLAWDLADVYMWSVDFTRDLQVGDAYQVLFERRISEEGEVRYGRVLAAMLTLGGKTMEAYRYEGEAAGRFYDADGYSLRRAFLRAPVQFRRISSSFSNARLHPILKIRRRHAGTDYSAASGTPVMAAGDGTVIRAGWSGGYGNLVEIRHRNGISTRYAHLRGFAKGVRSGTRVSQGDIIGFVGSTGLATSAHLHYEFLVNGVARDARRIQLDAGPPVPGGLRTAFDAERERLRTLLLSGGPAATTRAD